MMHHPRTALALIVALCAHQFVWMAAPPDLQGRVYSLGGMLLTVMLLALIAVAYTSWPVRLACGVGVAFHGVGAVCSVAWLVRPWPVAAGQGRCSAALDWPVATLAACLALACALAIYREASARQRSDGPPPGKQQR